MTQSAISGVRRHGGAVLVVEDDTACRDAVRETLEGAGFDVFEAPDGQRALDALVAHEVPTPAVVVLDLWMPQMSGSQFLRVIRSYFRFSRVPVIITTADRSAAASHIEEPFVTWLPKPFPEEALLRCVLDMLVPAGAQESRIDSSAGETGSATTPSSGGPAVRRRKHRS